VRDRSPEQRRGCQIIFQNPYEALNPRRRVRDEIARPARVLRGLTRRGAVEEVRALLDLVQLPARTAEKYPVELSGGERQRVAIARALAAKPSLLICDEITSALDVSVQATVVSLLAELRKEMAMIFITHNLGIVSSVADRVVILNRGRVCEEGQVTKVFSRPKTQTTMDLLAAAPVIRNSR
jgi:peptide/nickel transport system ATP-binding protein